MGRTFKRPHDQHSQRNETLYIIDQRKIKVRLISNNLRTARVQYQVNPQEHESVQVSRSRLEVEWGLHLRTLSARPCQLYLQKKKDIR